MGPTTASTDRVETWRDIVREHFVALDVDADRGEAFRGTVCSTPVGHLRVATVTSTTAAYRRTPRLAHRDREQYLQVGLLRRGAAVLQQDGREALLQPGDFAVYDTERPFTWGLRGQWQLAVLTWPRASVALADGESQALTARTLAATDGLAGIVGRLLRDLADAPPALTATGGVRLAHEVAELVTTTAAERAAAPAAAPEDLRRVRAHIAAHLGDPELGPATIAAAHFMSTRQLHRLFAQQGDTVSRYVRALRLERARRDLLDTRTTITEVARRWGFADLAGFGRAFRAAHGTTPSAYRASGGAGPRRR